MTLHTHVHVCVRVAARSPALPHYSATPSEVGHAEKPLPRAMGFRPDSVTEPTIVRVSVTWFAIRATVPSASDE